MLMCTLGRAFGRRWAQSHSLTGVDARAVADLKLGFCLLHEATDSIGRTVVRRKAPEGVDPDRRLEVDVQITCALQAVVEPQSSELLFESEESRTSGKWQTTITLADMFASSCGSFQVPDRTSSCIAQQSSCHSALWIRLDLYLPLPVVKICDPVSDGFDFGVQGRRGW